MNIIRKGMVYGFFQRRYKCMACGFHGKLNTEWHLMAGCGACGDVMVLPVVDSNIKLVTANTKLVTANIKPVK